MRYETDIAIVGAGPCGTTLANLLGTYGIRTMIVDREPGILDYPRAVALDDESLRAFQAVGLAQDVLADVIQNAPIRYYNSRRQLLAHVRPSGQPFGWPRRNLFFQPLMEAALRRGIERFDHVTTLYGAEITALAQTADGATLTGRVNDNGEEFTIAARYVVGADGGRSFIRRSVGIELFGETDPVKWLVVDVADDQLDAPYSAVYCDPDRPTMTIPLPYGYRRFEFKFMPGERDEDMTSDDVVRRLLAPYYRDTPMPTLSRGRVYNHHTRTASTFRSGSVFLAGDAAHLQPPFFGQGMNSGIRDALNLGWKLASVIDGKVGEAVLDTYDAERRPHAETMVRFAGRIGRMYQPKNKVTEVIRDNIFRNVQKVPGARDYILQMKYKPLPRYTEGVVVPPPHGDKGSPVGRMFAQPSVETEGGQRRKLDDILGSSFALLGLGVDPSAHMAARSQDYWRDLNATIITVAPPRTGRRADKAATDTAGPRSTADSTGTAGSGSTADSGGTGGTGGTAVAAPATDVSAQNADPRLMRVLDIDGGFRDMRLERPQDEIIVLRPDRYVAAVCRADDLDEVTAALRASLVPLAPLSVGRA